MLNKKFLSSTELKCIAIIAMTIDHIAFTFVPPESLLYFIMRFIGRLTAPIMSFFIVEGFRHTRNLKNYFFRMIIFAVISQPFYFLMVFKRTPQNIFEFLMNLNVMFNFCIGLIILKIISGNLRTEKKIILIAVCFAFSDLCDWSYIIPAWILIFFLIKNKDKRTVAFISISIILIIFKYLSEYDNFLNFSFQCGVISAIFLINSFNFVKNQHHLLKKWFFYIYYPLHMAVICILYFLKNSL